MSVTMAKICHERTGRYVVDEVCSIEDIFTYTCMN